MFYRTQPTTLIGAAFNISELIYHSTVRSIRKGHRNAFVAILLSIFQAVMMVGVFYLMMTVFGIRSSGIRGDFLLYIMSGVFIYMTHIRAVSNIMTAEGPTAAMMQHAPMSTAISICSAALSALYTQIISVFVMLVLYNTFFNEISILDPVMALFVLILAWFSGCVVGIALMSLKLWFPAVATILSQVYIRINMIASGKLFVANTMPGFLLPYFDWNPLFHMIDQIRGFIFKNYFPHHSSLDYPIKVILVLLMVALLAEFYTRQKASASWAARQ